MSIHDKAAGLAGLGGSVDRFAVAATFLSNSPETARIDDGTYAVAVIAARLHLPRATAFEVCRMAGLGGRH